MANAEVPFYRLVISKMRQHIENLEKNTLKIFCYKSKDRVRWPPKVGSTLADHFGELYHGYTYRGSSVQRDDVSIEVLTHESHAIFVTRGKNCRMNLFSDLRLQVKTTQILSSVRCHGQYTTVHTTQMTALHTSG